MSLPSDFLVDLKSVAEAPAMKLIYMCGNCINNAHMSCQRGRRGGGGAVHVLRE